jgi:hypothetical protein
LTETTGRFKGIALSAHGIVAIKPPPLADDSLAATPNASYVPTHQNDDLYRFIPSSSCCNAPKPCANTQGGAAISLLQQSASGRNIKSYQGILCENHQQ